MAFPCQAEMFASRKASEKVCKKKIKYKGKIEILKKNKNVFVFWLNLLDVRDKLEQYLRRMRHIPSPMQPR